MSCYQILLLNSGVWNYPNTVMKTYVPCSVRIFSCYTVPYEASPTPWSDTLVRYCGEQIVLYVLWACILVQHCDMKLLWYCAKHRMLGWGSIFACWTVYMLYELALTFWWTHWNGSFVQWCYDNLPNDGVGTQECSLHSQCIVFELSWI